MTSKRVLVTGAAGFIGFHLSKRLLDEGYNVVGLDNLNDYYDVELKKSRIEILAGSKNFTFEKLDISDKSSLEKVFDHNNFEFIINLAAQAGVRYSIENPQAYLQSNIEGFLNILEACRKYPVKHLIYASSGSVYGSNENIPFSVHSNVDHPLSFYAASKKANELMAHSYSVLYQIPTTGLRFFSAYGPYGRPDMALFIFTKAIVEGKPIDVYNHGKMKRDFTYVDDIVEGVFQLLLKPPIANPLWDKVKSDPATSFAPYRLFNIGNNKTVALSYYIEILENKLGRKATKNFLPMQLGDIPETCADIDDLINETGFKPKTSIEEGISNFVDWYLDHYKIKD